MIAIIDYGAGNLRSVQKACEAVGATAEITADSKKIKSADHVILPGVGAFGDCMKSLQRTDLCDTIRYVAQSGTPFLGICLGMQLLFESSEESPGIPGLGIFPGEIVRIPSHGGLKIPHMGWNSLDFPKESPLFMDLPQNPFVYFVHSFYARPTDTTLVAATCSYGETLTVSVQKDNVFATQFHPEKSGTIGLAIMKNFVRQGGIR